ncbi:UDP-forming cellulose synthase catalytic subunit [[Pseudomonas] boreopolis]|uniref:UDP-forming cellulose synthase catalytic subunit n=1 Tax=Xanthomonas boreopolis TaxID=86183 RepID=UPI003D52F97C
MRLYYLSWPQLRRKLQARRITLYWIWLAQLVAWALLRLEGPAWQGIAANVRQAFPQLQSRRRWRIGDPLRLLIQAVWVALVRGAPKTSERRHRFARAGRRNLATMRGVAGRGRARYFGLLQGAPSRIWNSALWQRALAWSGSLAPRTRRWGTLAAGVSTLALAALCVTQPFNYLAQFVFVALLWAIALLVRRMPGRYATLMLVVLSVTVSCRYLWWRYTATLNWNSTFDLVCGLVLLAAETYSWLVLMLGYVQVAWPLNRKPAPLPADISQWPTVDVLIPTYNEDLSLVRHTVYAALGLDWPQEKLRIHLLDDGRRPAFREFAERVGINYIARSDNRHAKAGNLNHALSRIDGELVAIFDCDHLPVRSFLQITAGWFLRDRRLALVQTPHHFFSPDPFERNLRVFRRDPNEGELFYGLVQDGNDLWNASFFCGSCAVIRREAIDQIGGFATETVTEDAHTALRLHRNGWNSAYLRIPQAAGLATDSLGAHVNQRIRWARGMVQIFRVDNPLLGKGLTIFQRFCYANAMLHFLAGIPRLVFLTAPLAFLLLHAYIIYAPALAILLFVLPHMAHASLANSRIQGQYRRPFWGEVYETVLAWYIARPTTVALFSPGRGRFNVTDKGGMQAADRFDWKVARPYFVLAVLNVLGLCFAVWRFAHGPADERGTVIVSSLWVLYNLLIVGGALAVAAEVQQVRKTHRVSTRLPVAVQLPDGRALRGTLHDYSSDGVGIELAQAPQLADGTPVVLLLARGRREFAFRGIVQRCVDSRLGVLLDFAGEQQRVEFAQCTFARADAWLDWHVGYEPMSLPRSLWAVMALGWRGYRRVGDFAPFDLDRPMHWSRRALRWLASFAPQRPIPFVPADAADARFRP